VIPVRIFVVFVPIVFVPIVVVFILEVVVFIVEVVVGRVFVVLLQVPDEFGITLERPFGPDTTGHRDSPEAGNAADFAAY